MQPHVLDLINDPRRAHFAYFRTMANPYLSVTANCDITALREKTVRESLPFFLSLLYCAIGAANAVPELRRRGTAQALLQALQERLAARGIGSLTLEVRASNLPAQRLYTAAGFACIGRRPNYYLAPREDALILRKELDHADPCH